MIKKIAKIIMLILMLIGITFSISNFSSVEIEAGSKKDGACLYLNGKFRCMGDGNECATDDDCNEGVPIG